MSTTIDQRVVEMRFDNRHFENNVSTTMSSLEKLKEKLNLTGAAKGLDNLSSSAKNINMSGLANGVDTVRAKFSALEVMGVTALANITNSAVNAGKRIAKSLTIDPIKSGFQEYELKMGSIQTIMASTGESLETVNKYLNQLNEYSDKTIYSFQDMTSNIGKFTNAGVNLGDAVAAMKGISNEAAVSGANANEASRAMYNFAQALSAGYVKLIDWKSIENANMATVEFKNELIKTAVALGKVTVTSDGMYKTLEGNVFNATKNFNEVFQDQWMTSDVLIETLKRYADETTEIGNKASLAATEVKTFSMMMDTLKESIQSGWAQTWEIVIGDFEQGKTLWTTVSNSLGEIVSKVSEARNKMLKSALGNPEYITDGWGKISDYVKKAGISMEDFEDTLRNVARDHGVAIDDMIKDEKSLSRTLKKGWLTKDILLDTLDKYSEKLGLASETTEDITENLAYFQKMFDEVWTGGWGNGQKRIEALTEAGHDYAAIQDLVNKHTAGYTLTLEDLSDKQLESIGYTKDQIESIRELGEEAGLANAPLDELIASLTKPTGRQLLLEAFANIVEAIKKPLEVVSRSWHNIFGDIDGSKVLYEAIEGFHALTESIILTEDASAKLEKIFDGLFYGGRLLKSVMGKSLVAMINLVSAVLKVFGTDLLDVAAVIADYIVVVGKWVDEHTPFIGMMNKVAEVIAAIIDGVMRCIKAFLSLDIITETIDRIGGFLASFFGDVDEGLNSVGIDAFVENIKKVFGNIEQWILGLNDSENIGQDIIAGIVSGMKAAAGYIYDAISYLFGGLFERIMLGDGSIASMAKSIYPHITDIIARIQTWFESLKDTDNLPKLIAEGIVNGISQIPTLLGPIFEIIGATLSSAMSKLPTYIFSGFTGGIKDKISLVWDTMVELMKILIQKVKDALGIASPSKVFYAIGGFIVAGLVAGLASSGTEIGNVLTDIFNGIVDTLKNMDWGAVMVAAFGLGAFLIAKKFLDIIDKIVSPLKSIKGAADSVSGFFKALKTSVEDLTKSLKITIVSKAIRNIALSILMLAGAVAVLSMCGGWEVAGAVVAIGALAGIIAGLVYIVGKYGPAETADFGKMSLAMLGMAGSLMVIALSLKLLAGMDGDEMIKAGAAIFGLGALMVGLVKSTEFFNKESARLGGTLIKMAATMLLMVGVIKLVSGMSASDITKGVITIAAFGAIMTGMVAITKLLNGSLTGEKNKGIKQFGKMMVKMAAAFLLMALVVKVISTISNEDIVKGITVIVAFGAILTGMTAMTKLFTKSEGKIGGTLLGMAASMVLMAVVVKLMAGMDAADIIKGLIAVTVFGAVVAALVGVLRIAGGGDLAKAGATIIAFSLAIGILAGVTALIGMIKVGTLVKGLIAVGLLTAMVTTMAKAAQNANDVKGTMVGIAIAIGVMAAALVALSFIKIEKLVPAVAALAILIHQMAILINTTGSLYGLEKVTGKLLLLTGIVVILAGVVAALSLLPNVNSALVASASISILMLAMSESLNIMSKVGTSADKAVGTLALMGLVVAELAVILGVMSYLNVEGSIQTAAAISILLLSMSGAMLIASYAGKNALAGVGAMALLGLVVAELAVILGLMDHFDINPSIETATAMSVLILALSAACVVLGAVGSMGPAAFIGIAALATLIAGVGGLIVGIGALMDKFPKLEAFLNSGIPILEQIGYALGSFFGNIVGGFLGNVTSGLPEIANDLTEFMNNLGGFLEGAKNIDAEAMSGVQMLAEALLTLTATSLIDGLTSWFTGKTSLADFALEIKSFISNLSGVGTFTEAQAETLKNAAAAIGPMTDAAKSIPNEGGWAGKIFGENSLTTFATGIKDFINTLSDMGTFSVDQVTAIENAADAAASMATAAKKIDGQAEWAKGIFGDNSLIKFAREVKEFISELGDIGTFSGEQLTSVKNAAKAISEISKIAKGVDGQSEWSKKLFGDNSLTVFADDIKGFVTTLSELDITVLDKFRESLIKLGESSVDKLIEGFDTADSSVEAAGEKAANKFISGAKAKYKDIRSAGKYLGEGLIEGIKAMGDAVYSAAYALGQKAVQGEKDGQASNSPSELTIKAGRWLGEGLVIGIAKMTGQVYKSGNELGKTATSSIANAISDMSKMVDTDIDTQPTIRPVLDLGGVASGIGTMNSMFGSQSVGVLANVNGISSMMNNKVQNGTNSDVISAIDRLRSELGGMDRATYNINGVTYDDGSNISDAVRTIVRAARIERRS